MTKVKKYTYSLYLAKEEVENPTDIFTESALKNVEDKKAYIVETDEFADGAILYIYQGPSNPPKWARQLDQVFKLPINLYSQSSCAVIVFKVSERFFVISFSYGHMYVDDRKTEADFGLRTAINFVSDEKLKSVERSNIGVAIRDFAQSASHKDLQSFGIDDVLDLIRKVSGRSNNKSNDFADHVTGARTLRLTIEKSISGVPDTAIQALNLFNSNAYKSTQFKIIDFLSPVGDILLVERLDEKLIDLVKSKGDQFEISLPEIIGDKVISYKFRKANIRNFHPDLSLDQYCEGLGARLKELEIDDLKSHYIDAYEESNNYPTSKWSVYKSLIGSLDLDGRRYALNEGLWYSVGDKIKTSADDQFNTLNNFNDPLLPPLKKICSPEGKGKNTYETELDYNKSVAKNTDYLRLDQRLIKVDDVVGVGVEACDLLDIKNRRLIHVKKSSRQSSVLSHFFKQGHNSARLLKTNNSFRTGLFDKVKEHYGDDIAEDLRAAIMEDKWVVEFQIADYPRANGKHNIPFFSKLTLKEESKNIASMGYEVRLGFITLQKLN